MRVLVHGASGRMGTVLRQKILEGCRDAVLAGAVGTHPEEGVLPSLEDFAGEADCIIDFSHHTAAKALVDYGTARRLPLVIATTGHTKEELSEIRRGAERIPIFQAGNFSMGAALLGELTRMAVRLFPDAQVEIVEQHHDRKLDVPSGTALMLAQAVQEVRPESQILVGRHENGRRTPGEIGIHSLRIGNTVGVHEVLISTGTQVLTLRHEAQDRALFAEGALAAAAFVIKQPPGLYHMDSLIRTAP